jgi:16S rRNA (guanine527-N7)-methyltransferase
VLEDARDLGFLGPGPVEDHIGHSTGFARAWEAAGAPGPPGRAADLGSGGGVPALVLGALWPATTLYLIESMQRRATFLRRAVQTLNLEHVDVIQARAEEVGRDPALRGTLDLVTSRSFGPPAVTAECAAPLLRTGGLLVVSEPPEGGPGRWPAHALEELGLGSPTEVRGHAGYVVLRQDDECPQRYPRRPGIPNKRPLS